jgi:hypothetical protein
MIPETCRFCHKKCRMDIYRSKCDDCVPNIDVNFHSEYYIILLKEYDISMEFYNALLNNPIQFILVSHYKELVKLNYHPNITPSNAVSKLKTYLTFI